MTNDDLKRMREGSSIKDDIRKIHKQINSLVNANLIQIKTRGEDIIGPMMIFDIPLGEKSNHGFKQIGENFINDYILYLENKIKNLDQKFEQL